MCNSHLDYHLMTRETEARLGDVSAPALPVSKSALLRALTAMFEKISLLLKGFARV